MAIMAVDKNPGGILSMIYISAESLSGLGKKVNLFVLQNSKNYFILKNKFKSNSKITIYKITKLEKVLFKLGIMTSRIKLVLKDTDLIFLHNPSLSKIISKFFRNKIILLFFHTDKIKHIKYFDSVNKVFSVNKKITKFINNYYSVQNKAYYLPNCLEKKITSKEYIKYTAKKNKKKIVIGAMGRLVDKKGFHYLIDAIKELPDTQLLIAGDGPCYKKLKDKIKDISNIEMLGWISNKEDFFKKIDIFCLSSTFEPFGIVLIEAMARGIPVVSTKCYGPVDIIKNNYNGLLVKKASTKELSYGIKVLKGNYMLRKKISKNSLLTIKNNYTIDTYKKNIKIILNGL